MRDEACDTVLLARTAAGDAAAFGLLHARHAGACRHRARFVLACEEWVDDVLQAVFLDVWRQADRFQVQRGSARGWLLQLTHFKAVDVVRAQERHAARAARELLLADRGRAEPSPEQLCEADEDRSALWAAVGTLPTAQRDVVLLCFVEGLTHRQAAERLGVPVGTVKSRSHAGLLRLRLLLGVAAPATAGPVLAVVGEGSS